MAYIYRPFTPNIHWKLINVSAQFSVTDILIVQKYTYLYQNAYTQTYIQKRSSIMAV